MPPPVNPPPLNEGGAITNPRMLNRWLDINPVFPLERTQTYITFPTFSLDAAWKGYSELVGVFNYASPNNFSLVSFDDVLNPNFVACVMWVDSAYNVYRYRLWKDVGEVFYFPAPLYTGQLIKGNFRIEIWTTPATIDLSTITVFGAGEAGVDDDYAQSSSTLWVGGGAFLILNASTQQSGILVGLNTQYNNQLGNGLFGLWEVALGDAPAPIVSAPIEASMVTNLTFYTTKKGGYDYMWRSDEVLIAASTVITDFSVALPANLPIIWPAAGVPVINN
jgi:hypothetical protein